MPIYRFTHEHLVIYGIHELQLLEDVLRRSDGYRELDLVDAVAEQIRSKI